MSIMKKFFPVLLGVILELNGYGQISFQKGYFIDNEDQKVDCLIKNVDWESNPDGFLFKRSGDEESQKATIETIKEFGIYDVSRYLRVTCDVDRSSDEISKLTGARAPEFNTEQHFLKVLVEGKASLFGYIEGNFRRFFFKTQDSQIEQLVFKLYRSGEAIGKNLTFRQQLLNSLQCDETLKRRIENLDYSQGDLIKLFVKYNTCVKGELEVFSNKEKRDVFNLWLRPRLTFSSASAQRESANTSLDFQFQNETNFSAGIEAEIILPFNKNKWAIIVEPTYQSYSASIPSEPIKVDYKAIEFPIGVRHYFFISRNSKISLSAAFQMNFGNNSTLVHHSNVTLELNPLPNMAFEVGYVFKNRLCVAYRYQTPREMLGMYEIWASQFQSMAIVVGYSIF